MVTSDNISILCYSQVRDLISNSNLTIEGSPSVSGVDSEIGPSLVVKSNQYFSLDRQNVFSQLTLKGTIGFWARLPSIVSNYSLPLCGIGSSSMVAGTSTPASGMIYFYVISDQDGILYFKISMHASASDIRTFYHGPIDPLELKNFIFSYDLASGVIVLYVDGAVVDLQASSSGGIPNGVPSSIWHNSNNSHKLIFNKFSSESLSSTKSGGFEISDFFIYNNYVSEISDIATIINDGSLNFILRKTGSQQGSLPSMSLPAVSAAFNRGRVNDTVNTAFGVVAGTEEGNVLLGVEKFWQRKISFGNPEDNKSIIFSKTSSNFKAEIQSGGYLSVMGSSFKIF